MIKYLILIILLFSTLFAKIEVYETDYFVKYKLSQESIQTTYLLLKNELLANGYKIVYEGDFAKLTKNIGKLIDKKSNLEFSKKLAFCKSSVTFRLLAENPDNILFCPFSLAVYKTKNQNFFYISYMKFKPLKKDEKMAKEINENIKKIIEEVIF
ncbi:MAG: hypothetical protein ACNI25_00320 [Halarcobacter sp.]